jgi:hypothetical protein
MKMLSCLFLAVLFFTGLLHGNVAASEKASDEYVFALEVEGQVTYQTVEDKGEAIKKSLRRMEPIAPGTALEIGKDASLSLTCPGCNVVNLTSKNSPYTVKMSDFKQVRPITSQIAKSFWRAIKNYISPETMPRLKVETGVRGSWESQQCRGFWPSNNEKILPIAESIIFEWDLECNYFALEIKDFDTKDMIFSEITKLTKIYVPVRFFKAGKRYEWFLIRERPAKSYHATFVLLTDDESTRIMKTFQDLPSLLPAEADNETRYRLQAGYLSSEGLDYAAWQWLKLKGVLPQPKK